MFPVSWRLQCCYLLFIFVTILSVVSRTRARDAWERPGCHKVGKKPSEFVTIGKNVHENKKASEIQNKGRENAETGNEKILLKCKLVQSLI